MWSDEARSLAEATAFCESRLEILLERLYIAHPALEGMYPAEIVEDALIFCGFHVVDEPLPAYQCALCDIGQKLIVVNSEMGRFVHRWTNLTALRRIALAHELGHVVLHRNESTRRVRVFDTLSVKAWTFRSACPQNTPRLSRLYLILSLWRQGGIRHLGNHSKWRIVCIRGYLHQLSFLRYFWCCYCRRRPALTTGSAIRS